MNILQALALIMLLIISIAAIYDMIMFEVPDTASILIGLIAVLRGVLHPEFVWWPYLAAPALMFAFGLIAFSRGWLGGGDVKLMVALAAWTGLSGLLPFFLATAIAGGGLAFGLSLARLATRRIPSPRLLQTGQPLPYAVAIAAGMYWWAWISRDELMHF